MTKATSQTEDMDDKNTEEPGDGAAETHQSANENDVDQPAGEENHADEDKNTNLGETDQGENPVSPSHMTDSQFQDIFEAVLNRYPPVSSQEVQEAQEQKEKEKREQKEKRKQEKKDKKKQQSEKALVKKDSPKRPEEKDDFAALASDKDDDHEDSAEDGNAESPPGGENRREEEDAAEGDGDEMDHAPEEMRVSNEITPCASDDGGQANNEPPKMEHKRHSSSSSSSKKKKKHKDHSPHRERDRERDKNRDRDRDRDKSSSKKLEFPVEKLAYISKEHNRMRRKLGEDPELGSRAIKRKGEKEKVSKREEMLTREIDTPGVWVQCSNSSCMKWRLLKDVQDPTTLPENWYCELNKEEKMNSCSAPEVDWDKHGHQEKYYFTKYSEGSIVLGKLEGYPWWPAMVEIDPDSREYFECNPGSNVAENYHVVFFDDPVSRAWVGSDEIKTFYQKDIDSIMRGARKFQKEMTIAIKNAKDALRMSTKERLQAFSFSKRYKGKWAAWGDDESEDDEDEEEEEEEAGESEEEEIIRRKHKKHKKEKRRHSDDSDSERAKKRRKEERREKEDRREKEERREKERREKHKEKHKHSEDRENEKAKKHRDHDKSEKKHRERREEEKSEKKKEHKEKAEKKDGEKEEAGKEDATEKKEKTEETKMDVDENSTDKLLDEAEKLISIAHQVAKML